MIFQQPAEQLKSRVLVYPQRSTSFRIAWLFPHPDLATNPSTRLRRYQISQYLGELFGTIHSDNIFHYDIMRENLKAILGSYNVVVIFSINEFDREICRFLKDSGVITIFDHCENIFGLAQEDAIMNDVTAITCCSTVLASLTEGYLSQRGISKNIFVIRDPIDDSALNLPLPRGDIRTMTGNRALVMGMGGNVHYALPFLDSICEQSGYEIMIISEHIPVSPKHIFNVWTPYTWAEQARTCSVALCYQDKDKFPAKGNVKVTMPMALGIPVIASPIESYMEAIEHGITGYIVLEKQEWVNALIDFKNPQRRMNMGLMARQKALTDYSTEKIGLDYLFMVNYLRELQNDRTR